MNLAHNDVSLIATMTAAMLLPFFIAAGTCFIKFSVVFVLVRHGRCSRGRRRARPGRTPRDRGRLTGLHCNLARAPPAAKTGTRHEPGSGMLALSLANALP